MEWTNPKLYPLGGHGPLYYMGIAPATPCEVGAVFMGDFRTLSEKMLYRLEEAYEEIRRVERDMETIDKALKISLEVWNAQAVLVPAEKRKVIFEMMVMEGKSVEQISSAVDLSTGIVAQVIIEETAEMSKAKRQLPTTES